MKNTMDKNYFFSIVYIFNLSYIADKYYLYKDDDY